MSKVKATTPAQTNTLAKIHAACLEAVVIMQCLTTEKAAAYGDLADLYRIAGQRMALAGICPKKPMQDWLAGVAASRDQSAQALIAKGYDAKEARKIATSAHHGRHSDSVKAYLVPAYNVAIAEANPKAPLIHYYKAEGDSTAAIHTTPPPAKAPKILTAAGKADDDAAESMAGLQPNANPSVPALADASADIYDQLKAGLESGILSLSIVAGIVEAYATKQTAKQTGNVTSLPKIQAA